LKKLEDVAVDYITLVQEHPDIWIEKQREQDEDNQSSNGEREPGQGP
jgi:hypothetical protein